MKGKFREECKTKEREVIGIYATERNKKPNKNDRAQEYT
jgi:hypothetical protein